MKPANHALPTIFEGDRPGGRARPQGNLSTREDFFPPRVLVVDDEPLIRWSVAESLGDLGYDVQQAADAATALRVVTTARTPIHAVVLDLRLPDVDDLSLLTTLRHQLPAARLVVMTAFGETEMLRVAKRLGAVVLHKPFEMTELTRAVLAADTGTK